MVNTKRLLESIQHSIDEGADVINASWGFEPRRDRSFAEKVSKMVVDSDTLVVAAAGNDGDNYCTIATPGVSRNVLTVGASDHDVGIAEFSSRGPTPLERLVKPEVVAPGKNVAAPVATEDGNIEIEVRSGTSCAAPVVTGGIAMILEAHPDWSARQVKNVVISTASPLLNEGKPYDVYTQGAGMVQVKEAINTELIVEDAVINFGSVYTRSPLSETLQLKNIGTDSRRIRIQSMLKSIESDENLPKSIEVDPSIVDLKAGEESEVELTIYPPNQPGIYSGRLFFNGNRDTRHTAIFGYTKFPPTAKR